MRRCYLRRVRSDGNPRRALSRPTRWWLAACLLVAACSDTGGESRAPSVTASTVPPSASEAPPVQVLPVVRDGSYDWRRVPIGAGGFVTGIVNQPGAGGAIYARTDVGGAYRWDTASGSWVQLITAASVPAPAADGSDYNVESIAVAPTNGQRVYAAVGGDYNPGADGAFTGSGRVLVSDDGGATWRTGGQRWFVSGNQRFRVGSERLAVDPANPDHVLYGTQREGLWSSIDAGVTWQQVPIEQVPVGLLAPIEADQAGVSTVAFVGGRQFAGVTGAGLYASDDGASWLLERAVAAEQYPSGAIAVGDELWVSINSTIDSPAGVAARGADGVWRDLSIPLRSYFASFAVDPASPTHVVLADEAVRDGHLWSSTDGGTSWREHDVAISSPSIPWLEATDLAGFMSTGRLMFDPAGTTLWFAEGMAVWRASSFATDEVRWVAAADGIEETVTSAFVAPPGGSPIAVVADRQGFLLDDLTRPPQRTLIDTSFVGGTSLDFSGGNPQALAWVGAEYHLFYDSSRQARGAMSTDGGRTWRQFGGLDLAQFGGEIAVSATDPNVLVWVPSYFADPGEYTRAPAGVWLSNDGGEQWERLADVNGVSSFHRLIWWFTRRALAADRVDGRFYLLSDEGRFFVSADGGRTWEEGSAPPCTEASACHVYGQVQAVPGAAGHLWASTGSDGLHRTDDAGATAWQRVEGLAEARAFGFGAPIEPNGPQTIFVHGRADGDDTLGLYRSSDDGATWERIADFPGGLTAGVTVVAGDPAIAGRVYIGFSGAGFVRGDPSG